MRKWLVFGGMLLAGASAAVASEATGPKPLGNPGAWLTDNDYPPAAMRAGTSGTTRFTLSLDATGKVSACSVTVTSGSPLLDDATCSLLTARASFSPARDASGRAIASTYSSSTRWLIPESGPIPLPHEQSTTQTVRFDVDAGGHPQSCRVEGEGPSWTGTLDQVCGRLPSMTAPFAPDPAGGTRRVTITVHVDVSAAPADPAAAAAAAHVISPH